MRIQTTGLRYPGALGLGGQRKLGARKEQTAVDDGLEEAALSFGADRGQEFVETQARPRVIEDGQPPVIESIIQLHLGGRKEVLAFEGIDDEITGGSRQLGNVADGARAWTVWSAERFADEVGDVRFAVSARRSSGLDEHGLHDKRLESFLTRQK